MRLFSCAIMIGILAGCAAPPPPEFTLYSDAFANAQKATADAVEIWEPIEKAGRPPTPGVFIPQEAAYIAPEGRAGNALLIERGFASVADYNEILALYASGQSVSSLKPQTEALSASVSALSLTVGLSGVGAAFGPVVEGLETVASALLSVSDRVEFARVVDEQSGAVDKFLEQVRDFTPDMYRVAAAHANARKIALLTEGRQADARKLDADLNSFRQMLASWVLSIDETRRALAALENAVTTGQGAGLTLGAVIYWTDEINRHAESVKFAARNISDVF